MEILEKLLGSAAKVKIMRLFLFSEQIPFDVADIVARAKVTPAEVKKEVVVLEKIGLVKRRIFFKEVSKKKGKKTIIQKLKTKGWALDLQFPYLMAVKNLLITVSLHRHEDLVKRFAGIGKLKVLIVSGVFIQDWESRVDLLIVGDNIRRTALENIIKTLESEIGKELRYSVFETDDFEYRLRVYDKLVRDILDFPHIKVLDKLDV